MRERAWSTAPVEESFGGIVTPLTFSFARELFANSYRSFARLLEIPPVQIQRHSLDFERMIGYMEGTVWFDFNAFLDMLALSPLYATDQARMLGWLGLEASAGPASRHANSSPRIAAAICSRRLKRATYKYDERYRRWIKWVMEELARIAPTGEVNRFDADDLVDRIEQLQFLTAEQWSTPSLNDFACTIVGSDLERRLSTLAAQDIAAIRLAAESSHASASTPASHLAQFIDTAVDAPELDVAVSHWLDRFGHRAYAELKLDTPTYADHPNQIRKHAIAQFGSERIETLGSTMPAVDAKTQKHVDRLIVLSSIREQMRDCRAELFARMRMLTRELGIRLYEEGALSDANTIHGLELDEIIGFVRGTTTTANIDALALVRLNALPNPTLLSKADDTPNDSLHGIPASHGIATAPICVVLDPTDTPDLTGRILVCTMTDPGWTLLFPGCAGIVTERGNPLSHSAIVARELGIPAVVGVSQATQLIPDGTIVTLDGTQGSILCHHGDTTPNR